MQIGDSIVFGRYEWHVFDIQKNTALIITECIIEQRTYHDNYIDITWADSSLRKYLNGEFYDSFSEVRKSRIISTLNKNFDNQWYGTKGGEDTRDSIFLLSLEEVACQSFGDSSSKLYNPRKNQRYWFERKDKNNSKRLAKLNDKEGCRCWWWWLRSPGLVAKVIAVSYRLIIVANNREEMQMNMYEEGLKLIEDKFGNGKDNVISLATIAREPGADGKTRPVVRSVDAYYEDGAFYVVTNAKANKMLQIEYNTEVSVAGCLEMFTANGVGKNLGWVLEPQNAEIRAKLRTAFADWYDLANNENDENCCILAVHLTKGTLNINHWEKLYHMDFENKLIMDNGGIF